LKFNYEYYTPKRHSEYASQQEGEASQQEEERGENEKKLCTCMHLRAKRAYFIEKSGIRDAKLRDT